MRLEPSPIAGVHTVVAEPIADDRGFFARTFCSRDFAAAGLSPALAQCSISFNARAGTLRGMHYQTAPHAEAKLVRCTRGAIFDVALDLRPDSLTFCQWFGAELTAANHTALYIPEGCAHGFQTLTDDAEVLYQISAFYEPTSARGVRWDDPAFAIRWPAADRTISPRDRTYPDFNSAR